MAARVKVLYFAGARDAAGMPKESFELAGPTTASELLAEVARRHPRLAPLLRSLRVSVNLEVVAPEARLSDGDEVGILPPVAGG